MMASDLLSPRPTSFSFFELIPSFFCTFLAPRGVKYTKLECIGQGGSSKVFKASAVIGAVSGIGPISRV